MLKIFLTKERIGELVAKIGHASNPMAFVIYLVLWLRTDERGRVQLGPATLDILGSLPLDIVCFGLEQALAEALTSEQMSRLEQTSLARVKLDRLQCESALRWRAPLLREQLEAIRGRSPYRVKVARIAEILTDLAGAETKQR